MKNNIKLAILSMSLMGLASCDMDAPSISTLDESSVFATYSLAESEVMSIRRSTYHLARPTHTVAVSCPTTVLTAM